MKDFHIIVVNFKYQLKTLRQCLDSVKNATGVSYVLTLVDNSPNDEYKNLAAEYDFVEYIANPENVGFARGVNQGLSNLKGKYALLLNGDVVFGPTILAEFLHRMNSAQDVAISSCVIRYPNGELQPSIRRFPTPLNQLLVLSKLPHLIHLQMMSKYMAEDLDPLKTQDVESIMGAFMCICAEAVGEIGLFDEKFFLWFEEVDYCKRVYDAGLKIRHYGDLEISHIKGPAFATVRVWKKQAWLRQSLRHYMYKHFGWPAWMIFAALEPVFIVLALFADLFKRY